MIRFTLNINSNGQYFLDTECSRDVMIQAVWYHGILCVAIIWQDCFTLQHRANSINLHSEQLKKKLENRVTAQQRNKMLGPPKGRTLDTGQPRRVCPCMRPANNDISTYYCKSFGSRWLNRMHDILLADPVSVLSRLMYPSTTPSFNFLRASVPKSVIRMTFLTFSGIHGVCRVVTDARTHPPIK